MPLRHADLPQRVETCVTQIIDAFWDVRRTFGPGLTEKTYLEPFLMELRSRGLEVLTECTFPLVYKGRCLNARFVADLIVNGLVVVEVKAVESLNEVHVAQTLTYLRISGCPVALLMNFGDPHGQRAIRRFVQSAKA